VLYVNNTPATDSTPDGTALDDTSTTSYVFTIGNDNTRATENWSGRIYQVKITESATVSTPDAAYIRSEYFSNCDFGAVWNTKRTCLTDCSGS